MIMMVRKTAKSLMVDRTCRGGANVHLKAEGACSWRGVGGTDLGGKVSFGLELLEEGRQEEGGEEEDDGPEENVGNVGAVQAAGGAYEGAFEGLTVLQTERFQVMRYRPRPAEVTVGQTVTLSWSHWMLSAVAFLPLHCSRTWAEALSGGEH